MAVLGSAWLSNVNWWPSAPLMCACWAPGTSASCVLLFAYAKAYSSSLFRPAVVWYVTMATGRWPALGRSFSPRGTQRNQHSMAQTTPAMNMDNPRQACFAEFRRTSGEAGADGKNLHF